MAAIYSNGGNRWNILGFNFTKRDALSSVYKISMPYTQMPYMSCSASNSTNQIAEQLIYGQPRIHGFLLPRLDGQRKRPWLRLVCFAT
jgi:hypothetical protein